MNIVEENRKECENKILNDFIEIYLKFTYLKYIVQYLLLYSELYNHYNNQFYNIVLAPQK